MIICNCILHIELPYVQSLKGRRSVTNSIKEKLKAFNLSVLDVSSEYAKEADIALVFLSQNSLGSAQDQQEDREDAGAELFGKQRGLVTMITLSLTLRSTENTSHSCQR